MAFLIILIKYRLNYNSSTSFVYFYETIQILVDFYC